MSDIHFRRGEIDDLSTLYDFEQGIVAAERPFDKSLKAGHIHYYDLEAMLEASDTDVIVAVLNDEIIGSTYLKVKKSQPFRKQTYFGYLGFMYVRPEHRGKGVSQQIVSEAKRLAVERNLTELHLDVYSENQAALRAYEKAGFKKHFVNMKLEL